MAFRQVLGSVVAAGVLGCAHTVTLASHEVCGAPIEGLQPLVQPGHTLVLGEVHGTREAADFVGTAVCEAAHAGPVVLGLEVPDEPAFGAYLASDGGPEARATLLASPFWTAAYQDGRENVAMLGLVERVRALRQLGLPLELLLFDAQPSDASQRDLQMAEKVRARHAERADATFVLVMGNLHARKKQGSPWNPSDGYGWLASRLDWPLVSLDAAHAEGTAWTCMSPKAEECGPHLIGDHDTQGRREVRLAPSNDGYDGVYDVVSFTAAPPAAFPQLAKGFDERLAALRTGPAAKIAAARRAGMKGDHATCAKILGALSELEAGDLYDLACCQSQLKQLDAAFGSLGRALERGFSDYRTLDTDTDLANLRADPRWAQLPRK